MGSEEFMDALEAWIPTQVEATYRVLRNTQSTERDMHTAQGELKVLGALQRAVDHPAHEFGSLWRPDEDDED